VKDMRITNSMLVTNMLSNLNRNLNVMSRKQDELATGKKVLFASDDPVAAAKIMRFKSDIADMTQYANNAQNAQSILDASESSVAEMGNVLQRVRELTVQAANGTLVKGDTQKILEEITQLRDHLISSGNSNFAGKYQFSSHHTDMALLTKEGKYNIPITEEELKNKPVSLCEISPNEYMPSGTHGLELFGWIEDTTSAYATNMPNDTEIKGKAATKAAIQAEFNLSEDYRVGAGLSVKVGADLYLVETTDLNGATVPLDREMVLSRFRNAMAGTKKLSEVADVYFDSKGKLIIRNKEIGDDSEVTLNAAKGITNLMNITDPVVPVATTVGTLVKGVDAEGVEVTGLGDFTPGDDFMNKDFVMTVNGITHTIRFPNTNNSALLQSGLQTAIDNAFGVNKVAVSSPPIKFSNKSAVMTDLKDPNQPSIRIQKVVTTEPKLIKDMNTFRQLLEDGKTEDIGKLMSTIDGHLQQLLAVRADIGARNSRLDLVNARISENNVTFTRLLSNFQDADMAEVIMYLKNAENVYKSALSVGGRIIQPSLLDFIR
jgi:flagellar hook-associated protein 3 FlgL